MDISSNVIAAWLEKAFDFVGKNKRQVLLALVAVTILGVTITGYCFYRIHVYEQAHKDLLNALKYYDGSIGKVTDTTSGNGMTFASETEKWQKTEQVFKQGYEDYKSTKLAPMFQAYQAEALQNQGKLDEAIKILTNAVEQLSATSVKDFYRVKLALMLLDCDGNLEKQQGLGVLKKIADNTQSAAHESALYYLGAYYWSEKKFSEAKNYWQMLLVKYGARDAKHPSQYAETVKEKLALLSVESL